MMENVKCTCAFAVIEDSGHSKYIRTHMEGIDFMYNKLRGSFVKQHILD